MTDVADAAPHAKPPSAVDLPDRSLFWKWVWSAVRPVTGWVLALAGTISLVVGWFGVSGESLTAKQLPYLVSAGFAGIALFIMAGVFMATDDVRRQFTRIAELERKVDDLYALFVADVAAAQSPGTQSPGAQSRGAQSPSGGTAGVAAGAERVALPAGSSYHQPGCALVAGKAEAAPVSAEEIGRRRLRPCRVCDPGPVASG